MVTVERCSLWTVEGTATCRLVNACSGQEAFEYLELITVHQISLPVSGQAGPMHQVLLLGVSMIISSATLYPS